MSFFDQLMTAIKYMALIGILAHVIGRRCPGAGFIGNVFLTELFLLGSGKDAFMNPWAFENGRIICRTRASIRKKPSPSR